MTGFIKGAMFFARGLSMLWRPKVRTWAAIPILLSAIIFAGVFYYFAEFIGPSLESMQSWVNENVSFLSWLGSFLWFLLALIAMTVTAYTFVIISSLVSCPFNPVLAEAAQETRTGVPPESSPWVTVIKGLPVTLVQETKKILYYALWAIPALILCLMFMPFAPFIWGAFSSWMLALEFTDYPMDNNGLKFREMRQRLAKRRMTSFGFGVATFLFATIPVANILTVPAAVCGATLMWLEELESAGGTSR